MHTRHFSQLPKPYLAYPKVIQGLIFKKPKAFIVKFSFFIPFNKI